MNKKHNAFSNEIKLFTDIPATRIASAFLIFFGLVLGIVPQFARNKDEVGILALGGMFLLGMAIVGGGVLLGNAVKRIDVIFRSAAGSIRVDRKGWFCSKIDSEDFDPSDIKTVMIQSSTDSDGDAIYQLILNTKAGRSVPLTSTTFCRETLVQKRELIEEALFQRSGRLVSMIDTCQSQLAIPKAVLLAVAVVCLLPLAATIAANYAPFSQLSLPVGPPDEQTLTRVHQLASSVLRANENILWVGQPEVGREIAVKWLFAVPFSIIWTLLTMFWTYLAWTSARESKSMAGYLMALFGMPFVITGFGLLCLPYFSHQQDLNTVYILTDNGAIRVINDKAHRLTDYSDLDFGPVELTRYKPERADVLFVKDSSEGQKHPYGGFYGVKDFGTVVEILTRYGAPNQSAGKANCKKQV